MPAKKNVKRGKTATKVKTMPEEVKEIEKNSLNATYVKVDEKNVESSEEVENGANDDRENTPDAESPENVTASPKKKNKNKAANTKKDETKQEENEENISEPSGKLFIFTM